MKAAIYMTFGRAENLSEEKVTVTCYGETKVWDSRTKAEEFYFRAMTMSEGSERERYTKIYTELKQGMLQCSDVE